MPAESGKKIIILHILTILKNYTDFNHPMTQQEIADRLLSDYGMTVNRATVKRNIADLMDAGYGIYPKDEIDRKVVNRETGEEEINTICTNFYYEHEFTESELHMLIDGLLFSRSVPYHQRKKLIKKLGELSSSHFSKRMRHVHSMNADSPENKNLFYNIEVLDEAITNGKQVEIVYGYYGTDLKLHARKNADGSVKKQLLNPYQLVASEGRYYLICNKDNYDNVANYRIDRIMDIRPLSTPSKPRNRVRVIYLTMLFSLGTENFLLAFSRSPVLWCAGQVIGWILVPLMGANQNVIMRNSIPVELQGRVYACRNTMQFFTIPIGLALGGFMVDNLCEPFMEANGADGWLTLLFGTGKGSGASLMMFVLGVAGVILCLFMGRRLKKYRYSDDMLPEESSGQ